MGNATFRQAKDWVSSAYGTCNDAELGEVVNTIRQHFHHWYVDQPLFLDAVECFAVQRFCLDCHTCADSYRGVTLPRECQTVEAMWLNSWPVELQSSWREFQVGISSECDCRLQKFDLPGHFSTALDILSNLPRAVRVVAFNAADVGKRFVVRGIDVVNRPYVREFKLSLDPQETEIVLRSVDHRGGVVKDRTEGRVALTDADGRMLGIYEPDETVPSYRRIKITGLPDDCAVVNIRCARKYAPLFGDLDVVETDNQMAFDSMARYLRLYRKTNKTAEDLRTEKDHLATAKAHMIGSQSRELGKGTQSELRIVSPTFMRGRMNRFR